MRLLSLGALATCMIFIKTGLSDEAAIMKATELPEMTESERLCKQLAFLRAMESTTTFNFSLAMFATAEEHLRDLALTSRESASCSLWSWSTEGAPVFTGCCVAESVKYSNNCSSDKPSEVTQAWGSDRYAGSGVEHVADLGAAAADLSIDAIADLIRTPFKDRLFAKTPPLSDFVNIGCAIQRPLVSVWLGNVPDSIPYTTGGAPPVDPNRSALGDSTTIIIGATVGGVGLCALCCALGFFVYQQRSGDKGANNSANNKNNKNKDAIVSGRLEEAGGQYGSTLGLKDASAPDNQIYMPPGGSVDSNDAIYAPDKIFNMRRDTMVSARSATSFGGGTGMGGMGGVGGNTAVGGVYAGAPPQMNSGDMMSTMNTGMMTAGGDPRGQLMTRVSQPAIAVDTYYDW
jgi:hypothetical protein